MTLLDIPIYFIAAAIGSAINAVAGGGTFITFPMLIINGLSPLSANVMSTVALWPGSVASAFAYRKERHVEKRRLWGYVAVSILGSCVGTYILLTTPEQTFENLVPWLLLFATLLFTFGRHGISWFNQTSPNVGPLRRALGLLLQFVIALYGGYFGAGIGILMLAMLQVLGYSEIHKMNALKTVLGSAINAVAVLVFVLAGKVIWPIAAIMIAGAVIGGYAGAKLALKISPAKVRLIVSVIGFGMTAYFFIKGV